MDMKRILQALDNVSTKPVEGANDMSKFLSIIDKATNSKTLTEGANPHKVTLPVQMAMQHYQQPVKKESIIQTSSLLKGYMEQVNEEIELEKSNKKQIMNQYANIIAKRVIDKKR